MEVRLCINPLEQVNWIERRPVLRPVCIRDRPFAPQAAQTHVTREGCNVIYIP